MFGKGIAAEYVPDVAVIAQQNINIDMSNPGSKILSVSMSRDAKYIAIGYSDDFDVYVYEKKPCHTSCATCSGPNSNNCVTCLNTLPPTSGTCGLSCNNPCSMCKYGSPSTCLRCASGYYFMNGTEDCVLCTAAGQLVTNSVCYDMLPASICSLVGCSVCNVDPSKCDTCLPTHFKYANSTCGLCTEDGFVKRGPDCIRCTDANCARCDPADQSKCLTCVSNYYVLTTTAQCDLCSISPQRIRVGPKCVVCSGNDYPNPASGLCNGCNPASDCETCEATNATSCLTCDPGKKVHVDGSCVNCMASGGHFVNVQNKCEPCGPNCQTCSSASTCTTCFIDFMLYGGSCVSCNSEGNFYNGSQCLPCSAGCKTCTDATHCIGCYRNLSYFMLETQPSCSLCTTAGWFQDVNMCRECDSSCLTCGVNKTNCLSCETGAGSYLDASLGRCVSCDQPGQLKSLGQCLTCNLNCQTCSGTISNCTSCLTNEALNRADNSCLTVGWNQYKDSDGYLGTCNSDCLTCIETSIKCVTCPNTFYMLPNQTCNICLDQGMVRSGLLCLICDPNCQTCGTPASNCTSCYPNEYLRLDSGNKCTSDCPSTNYYFTNGSVTYCDLCNANCLTCSNTSSNCTSCQAGNVLLNGKCTPCVSNCSHCVDTTSCTRCEPPYVLTSAYKCVKNCQSSGGTMIGSLCTPCSPNCRSCRGSAASCTSCIAGQYLSATNTCVPCTENGYYHNSTNCLQCDSSCLTCNGSTSTHCTSCEKPLSLTLDHTCIEIKKVALVSANFKSDMTIATFTFEQELVSSDGDIKNQAKVFIYECSKQDLVGHFAEYPLGKNTTSYNGSCTTLNETWSLKDLAIDTDKLTVKLDVIQSIDGKTLAVRLPRKSYLRDKFTALTNYPEDYLIVENVTVIKSALDGMMDSAAAPATATIGAMQGIVMTVSVPQAFVLLKVMQTLDYYIFIECPYPSNFAKFLEMITNSLFDYLPNIFESLTDDDGTPLYERFAEYGMKVHIFANLGKTFSVVLVLGALKAIIHLLCKIWRSAEKVNSKLGPNLFFGIFESYHMDSVMAVMIFVAQRERVNHRQDAVKYLVIVFVSLFSLFMISMYLFMGYTVSRLTDSYFKHAVIEIKNMKNEPLKFLLEDKNMHGNIFQRHFNLIQLFKDIVFAALLYALYYKPLVLIILLTLIQAVFMACVFAYPPYNIAWMNNSLRICQAIYSLLNLMFVVLIAFGHLLNERQRYYFVGFTMIALVLAIVVINVGFAMYSSIKDIRDRCNRKKTKLNRVSSKDNLAKYDQKTDSLSSSKNDDTTGMVSNIDDSTVVVDKRPDKSKNRADLIVNGNGKNNLKKGSVVSGSTARSGSVRIRHKTTIARISRSKKTLPKIPSIAL